MKKTILLLTLTLVLAGLTGCGTSDNSEVLEKLESMEETMNSHFERLETSLQPTTLQDQTPTEQPAEITVATDDQTPTEQPTETTSATDQTTTKLQVFAVNKDNFIPVKLVEGKLSSDGIHNPTDLGLSGSGAYRDLHLIFLGENVSQINWINGNTFENIEGRFPKAEDAFSHLYFNLEKGDGIYSFEVITENGTIYSFSIKYYKDNIIH